LCSEICRLSFFQYDGLRIYFACGLYVPWVRWQCLPFTLPIAGWTVLQFKMNFQ
jgi:hypothetical protein